MQSALRSGPRPAVDFASKTAPSYRSRTLLNTCELQRLKNFEMRDSEKGNKQDNKKINDELNRLLLYELNMVSRTYNKIGLNKDKMRILIGLKINWQHQTIK